MCLILKYIKSLISILKIDDVLNFESKIAQNINIVYN